MEFLSRQMIEAFWSMGASVFRATTHASTPTNSEQAFYFFWLVLSLGICLVWALYEVEQWREKRRWRARLLQNAIRLRPAAKKARN